MAEGRTLSLFSDEEEKKLEQALVKLRKSRGSLIAEAYVIAVRIAKEKGRVTSTEVLRELRSHPELGPVAREKDARFMGPVFRRGEWECIGREATGSHKRDVRIWKLRETL